MKRAQTPRDLFNGIDTHCQIKKSVNSNVEWSRCV
jgi:hypothetical protein